MPIIHNLSTEPATMQDAAVAQIRQHLSAHNLALRPEATYAPLLLTLVEGGELVGGVAGRFAWDWFRLDFLWVADALRGQGYGRQLLEQAEQLARAHGCRGAHLDSFSFQNVDFYRRMGYEVFGQLADYPAGATHYFLKKEW